MDEPVPHLNGLVFGWLVCYFFSQIVALALNFPGDTSVAVVEGSLVVPKWQWQAHPDMPCVSTPQFAFRETLSPSPWVFD